MNHPINYSEVEKLLELFKLLLLGKYQLGKWYQSLKECCKKLTPQDIEFLRKQIAKKIKQLEAQGKKRKYYQNYNRLIKALRRKYWQ